MGFHIAKSEIINDTRYYLGVDGRCIESINKTDFADGYGYHLRGFGYYMGYNPHTDIIYLLWYFS